MHTDLSAHLHSDECNAIIKLLKDCYTEHPFRKFMGYCDDNYQDMKRCLKAERLERQKANLEDSRRRHKEIHARIRAQEKLNAQPS